ncbi:MAG: nitroreductase [Desulfobulbaceae bacterium]|nr:MAG: nitroreductase [Desulfobulbaceae bacterium]
MRELIEKTRTFRRFHEEKDIAPETLENLVNLARLGGSARNQQPWQYMIVTDKSLCQKIFPYLGWAGYLSDWKGPVAGEQPNCYVLCLLNHDWLKGSEKEAQFDLGIATQNFLLGAMELGIGGCRIGAFSPKIKELFVMPEALEISLVLALGYPAETVCLESLPAENDIKYWRDENQIHHLPKRSLEDLLVSLEQARPFELK